MINQIIKMMSGYVTVKDGFDKDHNAAVETIKDQYGNGSLAKNELEVVEYGYNKKVQSTRGAVLAYCEREFDKAEAKLRYMVSNINTKSLNELKTLDETTITPFMEAVLKEKYEGDYYALDKLTDLCNLNKKTINQEHFVTADELLTALSDLKADVAAIVMQYGNEKDYTDPQGQVRVINSQLALQRLNTYVDRLTSQYLPDDEAWDALNPLTDKEKAMLEEMYSLSDKKVEERTAELLDQGNYDLIIRSDKAQYIPTDYTMQYIPSDDAKMLIEGEINIGMYAGKAPKVITRNTPRDLEEATKAQKDPNIIDVGDYGGDVSKTLEVWENQKAEAEHEAMVQAQMEAMDRIKAGEQTDVE
jgi:hypothetical protein